MSRRWEDDWPTYARVSKSLFLALRSRAARAAARGAPDAWRSFLASDAVTWLLSARHARSRSDAVALGRALVRDGLLAHIGPPRPFDDDSAAVFVFHAATAEDVVYRVGVLHAPARNSLFDQQLRRPGPTPHRLGLYEDIEHQLQARNDSQDSLLAFSEASVELNDTELLNGDWGEKVRPLNAANPATDTEMEPGAFRLDAALCATEFDEPQVAYKVLSIMSFEKNATDRPYLPASRVEPSRNSHQAPVAAQVLPNLPAFRQKLSTALSDRDCDRERDRDRDRHPEPHQIPVFANAPAFRKKLTAAFSQNNRPQSEQAPIGANPPAYRQMWSTAPSDRDHDRDRDRDPYHEAYHDMYPEHFEEPDSDLFQHPLTPEPRTPDRAKSVHSGRWGPRSGFRGRPWPLFSKTTRLFRGRRNSARSESGLSRYR